MPDADAAYQPATQGEVGRVYTRLPIPVLILCLGSLINRAGSFVMVFMTIYVSEQLGYGVRFATTCFGAFGVGSIIASLVGGQFADRFGRRPVMVFALFGGATVLALLSFTQNRWAFLGLTFLLALSLDMFRPAASAMVGDLVRPEQRPHAFALMYISFNLGFALAAPLGGLLAYYSFQWLFWGDALTTAVFGLIVVFFLPETAPTIATRRKERQVTPNQAGVPPWSAAVRHIAGDTNFVLFSLATLLTSIVFMQAFTTLPIHLRQIGYSEKEIGMLLATNGILIVICQLPVTHWLNRFDRVAMILVGEALLAIGFGLTTFAESTCFFLMTIAIWTLGEVVQASFKQSFVADLAPLAFRARYMGVFSLCHAVGITIGAPIGGEILSRFGYRVLWPACFAIVSVSVAIYGIVMRRAAAQQGA